MQVEREVGLSNEALKPTGMNSWTVSKPAGGQQCYHDWRVKFPAICLLLLLTRSASADIYRGLFCQESCNW